MAGEFPRACRRGFQGAVVFVPEIFGSFLRESIREDSDVVFGGHGSVSGGLWSVGWKWTARWAGELGSDLGSDPGLVELLLVEEELLLLLHRLLLVEALPLPLVQAAGEGARAAAHVAEKGEVAEKLREGSGTVAKEQTRIRHDKRSTGFFRGRRRAGFSKKDGEKGFREIF